jgi:hypothetical protein
MEIAKRVHPDDVERHWADREAALNPADPRGYAHQYRVQRSGGKILDPRVARLERIVHTLLLALVKQAEPEDDRIVEVVLTPK